MENSFLGSGMKFPVELDMATGRFKVVSGQDSVRESIRIILETNISERLARPAFGTNLAQYTFMDITATGLNIMMRDLSERIADQEPRIGNVDIDAEFFDKQGLLVFNIGYTLRESNIRGNMVYPFYLNAEKYEDAEEEGRDIPELEEADEYQD